MSAESIVYVVVAALLLVAAGFTVVGTVVDLIEGSGSRRIADAGVFLLDRVLLLVIIAELIYTLRLVDLGGQITVEPFLFVALIAIVRRVLVVTAEFEATSRTAVTDFVIEICGLGALAFIVAVSIHLLRRSGR